MKKLIFISTFVFGLFSRTTNAQTIDTIINVDGKHKLHFTIIKGSGAPILFESGLGDGGSVWNNITKQIADITGATIITYDRLSYGSHSKNFKIGIATEIKALESGLQKLGFAGKDIMLVSHSLGGMYNQYYASRHPNEVKAAVFIDDANECSLNAYFNMINVKQNGILQKYLANILDTVIKNPIPKNIPIVDIVAEHQYDNNGNVDTVADQMWLNCHKAFVGQYSNRNILIAFCVGHHIFIDNPLLVISAITLQYSNLVDAQQKQFIFKKLNQSSILIVSDTKKLDMKCEHKDDNLIDWAYSLLKNNEIEKAIEVSKLNLTLNPDSWNSYDSLAEAYLRAGNKELATKNYKKSLELNPKNDNATKVLEQIK